MTQAARTKVFCVGLGKTGTSTFGAAMKMLGYRHYCRPRLLLKMGPGRDLALARDVLERHDSFDDFPWPLVFRELDAAYPDAKFVLTVRKDSQTWLRSLVSHAQRTGANAMKKAAYGHRTPIGAEDAHVAFYEAHNAAVIDHFSDRPGKLLTVCWEQGDGWRELCEHLGVQPPAEAPFPMANAGQVGPLRTLARRLRRIYNQTVFGVLDRKYQ
ncbi:sulfotransferase family protein [Phenylobacterium sp.]|uniref:sulfotransferase family protein n=1 Tax=Phenylobacterium sp. TaxID=1871053 RepID=UPI0040350AE5